MPQTQLAGGEILVLIVAIIAYRLVTANAGSPGSHAAAPLDPDWVAPADPLAEATGLSLGTRIAAWWRRTFRARKACDGEWLLDFEQPNTYRVSFPMPRRLVRLDLIFHVAEPPPLGEIVFSPAADAAAPTWSGRWDRVGPRSRLRLDFAGTTRMSEVKLMMRGPGVVDCDLGFKIMADGEPDALALIAAEAAHNRGDVAAFRGHLEAYEQHCLTNPVVVLNLARLHHANRDDSLAEIYALRAIGLNRAELGLELCRTLAERRDWPLSDKRLQELRDKAAAWDLAGHHGLVALVSSRSYLMGPGGYQRERHQAAVLVLRRAAARKYRSAQVPMVTGWGGLIHTAAQVRRSDGTVDKLDDDLFTVGSAQDDNPFIAVARRNVGMWILPDLAPGDVVEYTWDSVKLGKDGADTHDQFFLANLSDPDAPTLHGHVSCTVPAEWELVCTTRNTGSERKTATDVSGGWTATSFRRDRVLPRRSHSDLYQRTNLNPLVACARATAGWDQVGRDLLRESYAAVTATANVPAALADAYAGQKIPREILARAFYWVRDHIKYASVASAHEVLSSPDRAERVVDAGVGDCKDVSHLLAAVCQQNHIPWEFVLMSTENGVILEDVPAGQFDHVIVRAQLDNEWIYLDASGSGSIFGAPPFPCLGLPALAGRDRGELITIPELASARTRITICETLEEISGASLVGHADVRLEGYPARMMDEIWKHESLVAIDPERAAAGILQPLLPDFQVNDIARLSNTSDSDVLHVTVHGQRSRLVRLDGQRIATLRFAAPGLPMEYRQQRFSEHFIFPYAMEVEYRLHAAGAVRAALRGFSGIDDLRVPFCTVSEERGLEGDQAGLARRIAVLRRKIEGPDLAQLPSVLESMAEATQIIIALEASD